MQQIPPLHDSWRKAVFSLAHKKASSHSLMCAKQGQNVFPRLMRAQNFPVIAKLQLPQYITLGECLKPKTKKHTKNNNNKNQNFENLRLSLSARH